MAVTLVEDGLWKGHRLAGLVGIVFLARQGGSGLLEVAERGPGKEVEGCAIQSSRT